MLKKTGATLPQETKDKLFITSLENIEYSILLETEARTMKWGWLFRTYVQWHAIAFLLSELCVRTKGEAVERAWRALEATAGRWWFPLNDNSPSSKGQPGCLWKPLRKLLAKAKAAREKELALERASVALRNGQVSYAGVPRALEELGLPPVSVEQPSPENLDRMLRPSAAKLGEGVLKTQSSWPGIPSQNPYTNRFGDGSTQPSRSSTAPTGHPSRSNSSPGHDFVDLTNFGLDNVLNDVMNDVAYDGSSIFDFSNLQANPSRPNGLPNPIQQNGLHNETIAVQPDAVNATATALNRAHGTFGDDMFGNVNFNDMPRPNVGSGNSAPPTESPDLDNSGNMDWTIWDDMVSQYGLEGAPINPNTNPASHMGLIHWF
jgi:hypothetical protein